MVNSCKICSNSNGNRLFRTREMMFGFRDEFNYVECASCGTVQIEEIPNDMNKYYPDTYYSYQNKEATGFSFKNWRTGKVYQHYFGSFTPLGAILSLFSSKLPAWMKRRYLKLNSNILDVGCGSGELLHIMNRGGFTTLSGVDPFISTDLNYESGVTIYKNEFKNIEGQFDFIMFHHSFEHMNNPLEVFKHINACLKSNGTALIRIPVADSSSYKKYGENWVNLDPPRHFFLHTEKSIRLLASQSGLELVETFRDANQFQFYGSELYLKNIPLEEYNKGLHPHFFSKDQLRKYRKEAQRLNKQNEGDWSSFYLRKAQ